MDIKFLFFKECPNYSQARENLKNALKNIGLTASIEDIEIKSEEDVVKYKFLGSPSYIVNGQDIEGIPLSSQNYQYSCRTYNEEGKITGIPSEGFIREKLKTKLSDSENILFLCTQNSCRSQMAEGIAREFLKGRYEVFSAGVSPSTINPYAIKVMDEIGITITNQYSKTVEKLLDLPFEYVITVCDQAKEMCPNFTCVVKNRLHWGFEDPARATGSEGEIIEKFRNVRDLIKDRIESYFK